MQELPVLMQCSFHFLKLPNMIHCWNDLSKIVVGWKSVL